MTALPHGIKAALFPACTKGGLAVHPNDAQGSEGTRARDPDTGSAFYALKAAIAGCLILRLESCLL